jgi:hypothetical protein
MSTGTRPGPALDHRPDSRGHRTTLLGRSLHALALGVAIGGFVGMVSDPRGQYVLAFVTGFVLWLLLTLLRTFAAVRSASPPVAGQGLTPADLALARVASIRRTGLELNGQPQCDLVLVVSPLPGHGPAYATTTRVILDVVTLAGFQPGAVVVVARPDPTRPDVRLVPDPPEQLAAAARAEARQEPGAGAIPALDRVPVRDSARTSATGFRAPTAGSLLWGLLLTATAAGAVLLPTLLS